MQLTHIRLLVDDFDACFRFYRDVMEFKVLWGEIGSGYADFQTGEHGYLALFSRAQMAHVVGAANLPPNAQCQDRVMIICTTDDLESIVAKLEAKGEQFITGIEDHPEWGIRTAYLRDPDGTLIELNNPLPETDWSEELREASRRYSKNSAKNSKL